MRWLRDKEGDGRRRLALGGSLVVGLAGWWSEEGGRERRHAMVSWLAVGLVG